MATVTTFRLCRFAENLTGRRGISVRTRHAIIQQRERYQRFVANMLANYTLITGCGCALPPTAASGRQNKRSASRCYST
ncbi:hypothetical protein KCP73_11310 [Salmonella enterica subsp. enterica]|nr:hypothetical protein KCP73_11310 [Salmonella enterica subsp. enterica]